MKADVLIEIKINGQEIKISKEIHSENLLHAEFIAACNEVYEKTLFLFEAKSNFKMANPTLPYQPQYIPPNPNPTSWSHLSSQTELDKKNVMQSFPKIADIASTLEKKQEKKNIDEELYEDNIFDNSVLDIEMP